MEIIDSYCYSDGLNYIVWTYSEDPKGIWIIHVGGPNKKALYSMGLHLLKTEFKAYDVYFHTQDLKYWRNHSVLDGWLNKVPVYKLNKEKLCGKY